MVICLHPNISPHSNTLGLCLTLCIAEWRRQIQHFNIHVL